MKRLFDFTAAALGLLVLALPLLVLILLIRRKLGSPVFFRQVRPGVTGWAQVNGRNAISWAGDATMPQLARSKS